MMMNIDKIWVDLENDKSLSTGLLLRRYSADSAQDIYVALQQPECLRGIAFRIKSSERINTLLSSSLKDIRVSTVPDKSDTSRCFLLILLENSEHQEVFSTLAEDLILKVQNLPEDILGKELLNRFEMWKALFDKAISDSLNLEEQRGLYGELFFLRKWLIRSTDFFNTIQSWVGVEKNIRDFQSMGWAIEVKTTVGNNHQRVHINSERQLDTTNLDHLFLYHLSLEVQKFHGETLNQLINSIVKILTRDRAALVQFQSKLLQGGYFSKHSIRYDENGYQIRSESFYVVKGLFPRIEERDMRDGVGDVKYSIVLPGQSDYLITETKVFDTIRIA